MITLSPTSKSAIGIVAIITSLSFLVFAGKMKGGEPGQNRIEIKDFHFTPETLTVKAGQSITWINRDEEPHTVVSVEKQFKKSPPLDTDQTFTITTATLGTYTYFCSVHPKMTGTIVVEKS